MGNSCCNIQNLNELEASTNFDANDKFAEILEFHDKVSDLDVWQTDIEEDGLKVLSKEGSVFDADLPVLWVQMTFDNLIPLEFVESLLTDPEYRLVWDKSNIIAMETLSTDELDNTYQTYQLQKFPWPMQNRDFVETKKRTEQSNEIRLIYYSVEGVKDEVEGVVRGESVFGVQRSFHEKGRTKVNLMSQTKTNINIGRQTKAFALILKSWVTKFKREIVKGKE